MFYFPLLAASDEDGELKEDSEGKNVKIYIFMSSIVLQLLFRDKWFINENKIQNKKGNYLNILSISTSNCFI